LNFVSLNRNVNVRSIVLRGRRDRMVVGFSTTCAISAYHH